MRFQISVLTAFLGLWATSCNAFQPRSNAQAVSRSETVLNGAAMDRRNFGAAVAGVASTGFLNIVGGSPAPANAEVFMDPAMYGDQELRVSAVDTVRESVRRSILQDPSLAPSFYQLSLLDGLSYDAAKKKYGPNGNVIYATLSSKQDDDYTRKLKKAAKVLIETEAFMKKKNAISIADCVAIAGSESIESIGGPVLPVQLGRMEVDKKDVVLSPMPLDILAGTRSKVEVREAFRSAGLTEREMTALLGGLLTLERVEKTIPTENWKASGKKKFVERGKLGRMSDYKMLTDEDIKAALEDEYEEDPDDGWYIADSFGTRDDRFGSRIAKDELNESNFNRYIQDLNTYYTKKKGEDNFGWIGKQILDADNPTAVAWLKKYSDSNLNYTKDLKVAFNSITQLGAVYTGGKYESLLKNKPRKSLNDDDLNLGFWAIEITSISLKRSKNSAVSIGWRWWLNIMRKAKRNTRMRSP